MNTQFNDITNSEIEAGFISPEMVEFENRLHTDPEFYKEVEKQAYADLYDLLYK